MTWQVAKELDIVAATMRAGDGADKAEASDAVHIMMLSDRMLAHCRQLDSQGSRPS